MSSSLRERITRRLLREVPFSLQTHDAQLAVTYHAVSDDPEPHIRDLYSFKSIAAFDADLKWISQQRRRIDITVDDGLASCLSNMAPSLKSHGLSAAFFIVPGWVNNDKLFYRHKVGVCLDAFRRRGTPPPPGFAGWGIDRDADLEVMCRELGVDVQALLARQPYLTVPQLEELHSQGFTLGAHSMTHRRLDQLPLDEAEREIVDSCAFVADLTGKAKVPFAFPHGASSFPPGWLDDVLRRNPQVLSLYGPWGIGNDGPLVRRVNADGPQPVARQIAGAWSTHLASTLRRR